MGTNQVFAGVKMLEFTWAGVGPQVGRELAEHGATVVRIESHTRPDLVRVASPFKDGIPGIDRSGFGTCFNTNKYDISLNLKKPRAAEVAKRLAIWADIVLESMIPGSIAGLGFDYESVRKYKPDIIYMSTCTYGQYGPNAKQIGVGTHSAAVAGFYNVTGWPDRQPSLLYQAYTDYISPFYVLCALIAALDRKRKTGKGVYLDQSQIEAGITFMGPAILDYAANGRIMKRMGNHDPYMAPHNAYCCKGTDRWCVIAVRNDDDWAALIQAIGEPEWAKDPKFNTFLGRKENEEELDGLIEEWTKKHAAEEVMDELQRTGVPAGVVQNSQDLFEDPQVKHHHHFQTLEHKVIGPMAYHSPAYRLSKTPCQLVKAGPCLGEDNECILKKLLGYNDDEISDLLVEGDITTEADLPPIQAVI